MKLLANENFPLSSYHILKDKGYDIKHIGIEVPSVSDREVMEIAMNENQIRQRQIYKR